MANVNITYQLIEGAPKPVILKVLADVYQIIFDDADVEFFGKRFEEKVDLFSVLAFSNNDLVGFKIGYRYSETTFYSWVGGVIASQRNQGVANKLSQLQEHWAKEQGYKRLRTKSMNRFKPMMILNLKKGFDIKQVYTNKKGQTKVVFEKKLS